MPKIRFTPGRGLTHYNGTDIATGESLAFQGPSVREVSEQAAEYLCATFPHFTLETTARAPSKAQPSEPASTPDPPRRRVGRLRRKPRNE